MVGQSSKDKEKIQHLEHQLKRALADYANLQKRIESEREDLKKFGESVLLTKILPVLDTLESLEKIVEKKAATTKKGVEVALEQFKKILKEEGVEEIKTDAYFDPRFHEAVEIVKGEADNKVVEVVVKGFRIGDRVLRPARVKVAKNHLGTLSEPAAKELGGGDYV